MPHSIVWEPDGIYRVFTGTISEDEILESNMGLYSDYRFNEAGYIINDFSGISGSALEPDDLQAFALTDGIVSEYKHEFLIALVVPQPELIGLAKRLCELTEKQLFKYAIFQTVEDARKWVKG